MKDLQYNIALAIFFPFYILAEIPSNMMMQKHGPIIWLTAIMFSWGLVMTCMGFVQNFSGLVVCRIFLGISEASVYPGISFFISRWYRRHETCFRMALVFSSVTAAGAFGGLLASAISRMSGVAGKAGWSWIFILEGLLTLCVATFGIRGIHDYPATCVSISYNINLTNETQCNVPY
jgi:MFS family permease